MAKESIASAYVQIIPSTEGISGGIAKAVGSGAVTGAASKAFNTAFGAGALTLGRSLTSKVVPAAAVAAGTAAVVNFGKESVKTGMEFDASMSQVYSLMNGVHDGAGLTEEEMKRLRDRAREMGATTQYTAAQSAEAMSYMALAGWRVNEVCERLPDVLQLAAASGMDLGRASDIVTDYMAAFSHTAPSAVHLVDLLAYAQASSNSTTEGFAEAWKYSAGLMNMFGQSADTTTAILARLANQGHKSSTGGTELTAVMTALYKAMDKNGDINFGGQIIHLAEATEDFNPEAFAQRIAVLNDELAAMDEGSPEYLEKVAEINRELASSGGGFRNIIDVFAEMQGILNAKGAYPGSQAYVSAMGFFGNNVRSMRGISAILNGDVGEMAAFEDALKKSSGFAAKQMQTMTDNLSGDKKILASAFDELKISVSDKLTPSLRIGTQWMTGLVQGLAGIVRGADPTANSIESLTSQFEGLTDYDYEMIGRRIEGMISKLASPDIDDADRQEIASALQELYTSISGVEMNESGENIMAGIAGGMTTYDMTGDGETVRGKILDAINTAMNNAGWETTGAIPARGIGRGITNNKSKMTTPAKQAIDAVKTKARDEIGQDGAKFNTFGADIAKGIAQGVTDGESGLEEAINKIIDDALAAAREHAGVNSPSTLFAEQLGRWIPMGVAEGVSRYAGDAVDAVDDMTGALLSGNAALLSTTNGAAARGGFVQNVTINSPRALTPLEVARQTRNATRRFVEGIS